jgi:hypothetical protein
MLNIDSLPIYYDNTNGKTGIGLFLDGNLSKPTILYLDTSNSKNNHQVQLDSFMTEIGQIPIESKIVIHKVENFLSSCTQNDKTIRLEKFLEHCKRRARSDRKII